MRLKGSMITKLAIVCIAVLVWQFAGCQPYHPQRPPGPSTGSGQVMVVVDRVVDGDTIRVHGNGISDVRLIGVDTPETKKPGTPVQCYGPEASAFTKHLLPPSSTVVLTFDSERTDRYGRTLAYMFKDSTFVNLLLVQRGYARAVYFAPNGAHRAELEQAQKQAMAQHVGRWSACPAG